MSFRDFIIKLQGLPDKQKKIILWTVVVILALVMGFIWFKISITRFEKIEESMKNMEENKLIYYSLWQKVL